MAIIPLKRPWREKPTINAKPNRPHWLGKHLKAGIVFNPNRAGVDFVDGTKWTFSALGTTTYKDGWDNLGSHLVECSRDLDWTSFTEATIVSKFTIAGGTQNARIWSVTYSGGDDIRAIISGAGYDVRVDWDDTTFTAQTLNADGYNQNLLLITSNDGATTRCWLYDDDTKQLLDSASVSESYNFSGTDGTIVLSGTEFGTSNYDGLTHLWTVADKAVRNDAQARNLANNVWQLFQAQTQHIPVGAAAAGGGDPPPTGSLALMGLGI